MYAHSRRSRDDIVAEILKTASLGAIKTHIMYRARLGSVQLERYIALLIEKGLLQKRAGSPKDRRTQDIFETSTQGEEFLRIYRTLDLYLRA